MRLAYLRSNQRQGECQRGPSVGDRPSRTRAARHGVMMMSCVYSCKCQVASRSVPDAVATHRAACSAQVPRAAYKKETQPKKNFSKHEQVPRAASEAGRHDAHVVLGGGDGAPHRLDRLAGELADGALAGEHHRVAAYKKKHSLNKK